MSKLQPAQAHLPFLPMTRRTSKNATLSKEDVLWATYFETKTRIKAEQLSEDDARALIVSLMAERYNVDPDEILSRRQQVLYTNVSKLFRLVFPKYPRAAADLEREIRRGDLALNDAFEIARGNVRTREEARALRKRSSPTVPHGIDLGDLFLSLCSTALQSGFNPKTIADSFEDALSRAVEKVGQ